MAEKLNDLYQGVIDGGVRVRLEAESEVHVCITSKSMMEMVCQTNGGNWIFDHAGNRSAPGL